MPILEPDLDLSLRKPELLGQQTAPELAKKTSSFLINGWRRENVVKNLGKITK